MDPNLGLPLQPPPPLNFAEFGAPVIYVDTEKQRSNNRPLWDAGFDILH